MASHDGGFTSYCLTHPRREGCCNVGEIRGSSGFRLIDLLLEMLLLEKPLSAVFERQ
jgi:hypothetical protein